jgi:hypothetical protein
VEPDPQHFGNKQTKVLQKKKSCKLFAAFSLFVRTLPIHFALLGRKRKYIKSQTTAKLLGKQTSIAVV